MYDGNKIIPGLIIFFGIITYPLWYNTVSGKNGYVPKPKVPKDQKECIEPKAYIRVNHKDLLENWKTSVVRNGARQYVAGNKKTYNMSLTKTCMNCHKDKAEFCDQCHTYAAVTNNCWDCHIYPKQLAPSTPEG